MDDEWDSGFTTAQPAEKTDMNNNDFTEKKGSGGFGFGGESSSRGGN